MNRKARRDTEQIMGKEATDNLLEKIFQFNKLPDQCAACQKEFNKKNPQMIESWKVVVRQKMVRLFCPDCIHKTQEVLNERPKTDRKSLKENS